MAIEEKVVKVIKSALNVDKDINISPKNTLEELSFDSLKIIELIFSIEEFLDIDDIESMIAKQWGPKTTVQEIINFTKVA